MRNILMRLMSFFKTLIFEKGHLIYWLNLPFYRSDIMRLSRRKPHEKIRVGFIIQVPNNWSVLEPVYLAAQKQEGVEPVILLMPELEFKWYVRLERVCWEETYVFGRKRFGDEAVRLYRPEDGGWVDPAELELDYIFLPRPYETYLPKPYRASSLRRLAKVCYVPYSSPLLDDYKLLYNTHFIRNVSMIFCEKQYSYEYVQKMLAPTLRSGEQKAFCTGFPKFDLNREGAGLESQIWPRKRTESTQRVIWTPRWNMDPGLGGSSFMRYKDSMLQWAASHPDRDLVFRPHPLAREGIVGGGYMTEEDWESCLEAFRQGVNTSLDLTQTYYDLMWSSDVLISDVSSMVMDYLLTGHPVIYCRTPGPGAPSDAPCFAIRDLLPGLYVAGDFGEVESILEQLHRGEDPKRQNRIDLAARMRRDGRISEKIISLLMEDAEEWRRKGKGT